jgi:hypothetical protein
MHEYEVLIRATMTDFIKVKIKAHSIIAAEEIVRKMIRRGEGIPPDYRSWMLQVELANKI